MKKSPKAPQLKDLLAAGAGGLAPVLARAARLEALTARVVAALPPDVAGHIIAVSAGQKGLVVTVDSAAWAARLRFMENEVREAAGPDISAEKFVVRVRPPAEI